MSNVHDLRPTEFDVFMKPERPARSAASAGETVVEVQQPKAKAKRGRAGWALLLTLLVGGIATAVLILRSGTPESTPMPPELAAVVGLAQRPPDPVSISPPEAAVPNQGPPPPDASEASAASGASSVHDADTGASVAVVDATDANPAPVVEPPTYVILAVLTDGVVIQDGQGHPRVLRVGDRL